MTYIEELIAKVNKEEEVFIAPNAIVIGDVKIGKNSSIWFNAVIRADNDSITIGERSNIQDGCIIHVDPGFPVVIGNEVILGHAVILHGAQVSDNTLIGMRATILNGAKIGKWCIIGANTLVTENMEIPDYSVVLGSPGKIVKQVTEKQIEKIKRNADVYVKLAKKYSQ
jgi:carbonic anhydrase/acetyltransferase-like protein (isoleucine patch superfamily)